MSSTFLEALFRKVLLQDGMGAAMSPDDTVAQITERDGL
jgi:hypothetical protein